MGHGNEIGLTRKISNEFLIHHVNIDISPRRMPERARQRADDFHAEILPEFHSRVVGRNDEIKLNRAVTTPARLGQTVFAQSATDPPPAPSFRHNKSRVRDVSAASRLVFMQGVGAEYLSILFGNTHVRAVFEPISQRLFARNVWVYWIRFAGHDHFLENFPDRGLVRISRRANFQHGKL